MGRMSAYLPHGRQHGKAEMLAILPWCYAADDVRAPCDGILGISRCLSHKSALSAMTLQNPGFQLINPEFLPAWPVLVL
jgi:hypothetical protein